MYVFGVQNLKKNDFSISVTRANTPVDIRIKSYTHEKHMNKANSLISYLKHLYLPKSQI